LGMLSSSTRCASAGEQTMATKTISNISFINSGMGKVPPGR
jgi:hypothetical protein